MSNWERAVDLVQAAFGEGRILEENMWQAVVLISKGKRDYHGIGLMEVMWKVLAAILNRRITASITFNEFLHGFRAGCGMGTAIHQGQTASAVISLEGGGPVRYLSGTAQGI